MVEVYGEAAGALAALFRPRGDRLPLEGEVRLGRMLDPSAEPIDEVLLAAFPAAASWCGVPGWAISSHGGALVQRRLKAALRAAGGREVDRSEVVALARALGALDRSRGEALVLLPGARTERAARYLLRMLAGELSAKLAEVERKLAAGGLAAAGAELRAMLEAAPPVGRLFEPRRILIAGKPNSGKSSLYNRLLERERALVSPIAGTTRDLLEEEVALEGYPVVLIDSAGLRATVEVDDDVEREGIRRARAAAGESVLYLIDHPGPPDPFETGFLRAIEPGRLLVARTKADLWPPGARPTAGGAQGLGGREAGWTSARSGEGLAALRDRIRREWLGPAEGEDLPAAPFTASQGAGLWRARVARSVDAMREALLQWQAL